MEMAETAFKEKIYTNKGRILFWVELHKKWFVKFIDLWLTGHIFQRQTETWFLNVSRTPPMIDHR